MTTQTTFRVGDVVRYSSERNNNWCREGMALAVERRDDVVLLDTFWSTMSESHVLTETELATAELLFNTGDYDELDRYNRSSRHAWEKYAPEDRQLITSQHRLECRWFIRKGATESLATQVENARERLAEAESKLSGAQSAIEWAALELAGIEAQHALEGLDYSVGYRSSDGYFWRGPDGVEHPAQHTNLHAWVAARQHREAEAKR